MLTIFTVPKPFRGHIGTIQRNAIRSWTRLRPECEVLLCGDDEGTAETAAELGVRHIAGIATNEMGSPLLSSVFAKAQAAGLGGGAPGAAGQARVAHSHLGVDYFVFSKQLWPQIPPFAIGRMYYDRWLIAKARVLGARVIDATERVTCVHQNHERTYATVGLQGPPGETLLRRGSEARRNLELAGGKRNLFSVRDSLIRRDLVEEAQSHGLL